MESPKTERDRQFSKLFAAFFVSDSFVCGMALKTERG
jgi:hypothetical protein